MPNGHSIARKAFWKSGEENWRWGRERDMKCNANGERSGRERQSQKSLQKGRTWLGMYGTLMLSWQHVHRTTQGDEVNRYSTKCRGVLQKIYMHRAM
jgi:hypothetical protein